ncbi:MAG: bifunctional (p)ppGpp synthetase/guanosine-3',5'-bis(diphosphate) 3'-pyrophosphohydrolase [Candidatus Yanofskybacteria bacterium]|nr:bifunctional (p)ppGpp synthetase/guanosine-3',5'-bis(diphosphate) 3'-pyrophosphohydrolase [Candidatus Yanofskybacteria bacterium]
MIQKLLTKLEDKNQNPELITKAFEFAKKAHDGQLRMGGEPYITHPVAVAETLCNFKLDSATIVAGILHDTVEDTQVTEKDIEKNFGKDVAFLVRGVTKLANIEYKDQPETKQSLHAQSLRKMLFAMAEDIRVILIKLADRYHNMKTIKDLPADRRKRISLETLDIYGPIAERLGMGHMKGELEDMAFPHAYPEEYDKFIKLAKDKYIDRHKYLEKVQPIVTEKLKSGGIEIVNAHSRAKHYFSLYKKFVKHDRDLSRIYDLVALRIILPDISSCYGALGIIHKNYKPLPGLIKDYIAMPKLNGYQSIHTTIFCEQNKILEIQLRTPQMHEHAENGVAAHWSYGESNKNKLHTANLKEAQWVAGLKKWMENSDDQEFYKSLHSNFFSDRVFVFTPSGEIKDLPDGSTPLDFAYAVHTDLGHTTRGAKINGKLVSLDYKLKSGQMVEIVKAKTAKPSADWLRVVKSVEAKRRILSWLKLNRPDAVSRLEKNNTYPLHISVTVKDKIGVIEEIGKIMRSLRINIAEIKHNPPIGGVAEIKMTLALKRQDLAQKVIQKLNSNKKVLSARKLV